jgi:hypothetical protein
MARPLLAVALWLCLLVPAHVLAESGEPAWVRLNSQQKQVLSPLAQNWDGMDAAGKKKWLSIAKRYPNMSPLEQQRIQSQMREWAALTSDQRNKVREKYKNIKQLPPEEHQKIKHKWREYEQLREEQKKAASSLDNVPD